MSTQPESQSTKIPTRTRRDQNWITVPGLFSIRSSRQKRDAPASLYIIGMVDQPGCFKIGIAADVSLRLIELQTASPFRLHVVFHKEFDSKREARAFERELHQRFSRCQMSGEWFRLNDESFDNLMSRLSGAI